MKLKTKQKKFDLKLAILHYHFRGEILSPSDIAKFCECPCATVFTMERRIMAKLADAFKKTL
jgi:DNA-directed RNA polymerase specialized sigma24 family protein